MSYIVTTYYIDYYDKNVYVERHYVFYLIRYLEFLVTLQ